MLLRAGQGKKKEKNGRRESRYKVDVSSVRERLIRRDRDSDRKSVV